MISPKQISGISDILSFGFAPQSLLAPLGAITLVCNLLVAPLIDAKEKLTKIDILATTIISVGVIGCVSASLGDNENSSTVTFNNLQDLEDTVTRPVAIQFICAVLALLAILFISMFRLEKRSDSPGFRGAIYPIISGLFVCLTMTSAKFVGEVGKLNDESSTTWLLVFGWLLVLSGALMNVYIMNRGFSKGIASLFSVPIVSGCAVMFSTLSGAFFWGESSNFTAYQWKAIPISVAIVLLGISVLLSKATASGRWWWWTTKGMPLTVKKKLLELGSIV